MRGAPGNTINHPTSYWVPRHSPRVFVERVDMASGVGYDRAAGRPGGRPFHEIRLVVTNQAVLDFATPDHSMRLRSVHPGVAWARSPGDRLRAGHRCRGAGDPEPTPAELALIRGGSIRSGLRDRELA